MGLASAVGLVIGVVMAADPAPARTDEIRELSQRVQSLVARINENCDLLHSEVTPAGWDLAELGLSALRYGALELIISDDVDTRRRGEFVLAGIVERRFGFVPGLGWRQRDGQERCNELWDKHGGYDPDMPEPKRRKCYVQWKAWVAVVDELAPPTNPNRLRPPRVDPPTAK
jgi:hypothetical protein